MTVIRKQLELHCILSTFAQHEKFFPTVIIKSGRKYTGSIISRHTVERLSKFVIINQSKSFKHIRHVAYC